MSFHFCIILDSTSSGIFIMSPF